MAVFHPAMRLGGSEIATMWAVEALESHHDVSLLTGARADPERLNQLSQTSCRPDEVTLRAARIAPAWGAVPGDALRGALFSRFCRRVADEYDVLISGYNVIDFGCPAIHRVADFSWDAAFRGELRPSLHSSSSRWARFGYDRVVSAVAPPTGHDPYSPPSIILANSAWTAARLSNRLGVTSRVLYPPVPGQPFQVPIEQQERSFVYVGRIAVEKRIEEIVEIVTRLRLRHGIGLTIIGAIDGAYARGLVEDCAIQAPWVRFEGPLLGDDKHRALARHRYGIHAHRGEAFGIGVAEMVRSGSIVFVPKSGGPAEIVSHEALAYDGVEDGVAKIGAVLDDPGLELELRAHLQRRASCFSTEAYMKGIVKVVEEFAETVRASGR